MQRVNGILVALAWGFFLGSAGPAGASVLITIDQVGANVVMTGSGSLDLTGAILDSGSYGGDASGPFVEPDVGAVFVGAVGGITDNFYHATGPGLGTLSTATTASSGSGDDFGVGFGPGVGIALPTTYVSKASLSASDTYDNQTFSGLGLTPGTYTYTLPSNDTLTLQIGPAVSTPEPSSFVLLGMAVTGLGVARWRKRKQTA